MLPKLQLHSGYLVVTECSYSCYTVMSLDTVLMTACILTIYQCTTKSTMDVKNTSLAGLGDPLAIMYGLMNSIQHMMSWFLEDGLNRL